MIFAFFRFDSPESQARFNTDALFLGTIFAFLLMLVMLYCTYRIVIASNDIATVRQIAENYESQVSQQVREGKVEIIQNVDQTKETLGHKIDALGTPQQSDRVPYAEPPTGRTTPEPGASASRRA